MDFEIRQLQENLLEILNASAAPIEAKRLLLALLAKDCELKANALMQQAQREAITEEGELNGSELDEGSRCE